MNSLSGPRLPVVFPQGCLASPGSLLSAYVGCLSLGLLVQDFPAFICLALSGRWAGVREGGREDSGTLRTGFQRPRGVSPEWRVVLRLPWWQGKALLVLQHELSLGV